MILLCRDYVLESVTNERICRAFQGVRVLCVSDIANLSSHSGQTALVTLVSLLARMGLQVALQVPKVDVLSAQPPFSSGSIQRALTRASSALMPGATVSIDSDFAADLVFVLGNTKVPGRSACSWVLSGSEWDATLSTPRMFGGVHTWTSAWPVGAMACAALAANEAFKFVVRQLPLRSEAGELFEPSHRCHWDFGSCPIPDGRIDLGRVDVVSAGAISQAVLFSLLRMPKVEMRGRIFDDDRTCPSNLNRNMLSLDTDVGFPKAEISAARCAHKLQLQPIVERYSATYELGGRVLVGVDDIPSRWEIQRHSPGWVGVSGTSHFSVSSSAHSRSEPCSGCLHPVDDVTAITSIPTISYVSFWAGLALSVRLIRECLGVPYSSRRQHLWLTPLRMDLNRCAMWFPVAARPDCPVGCAASRRLRGEN